MSTCPTPFYTLTCNIASKLYAHLWGHLLRFRAKYGITYV
jgi:hypothetical protein